MTRISEYKKKTLGELVGIIQDIREPLQLYNEEIIEDAELELMDKDGVTRYLILLEGKLYKSCNEDRQVIQLLFEEASKWEHT